MMVEVKLPTPKIADMCLVENYEDPVTHATIKVLTNVLGPASPRFFSTLVIGQPPFQRPWNFELKVATLEEACEKFAGLAEEAGRAAIESLNDQARREALLAGVEAASPRRQ